MEKTPKESSHERTTNSTEKMTLEQAIKHASDTIPEGWKIRLVALSRLAYVEVIRPDGTGVMMFDSENDLEEQIAHSLQLIRDESKTELK